MSRGFPWPRKKRIADEPEVRQEVLVTGEKVVLREKTVEDASDDYGWRTDRELARHDATRPLNMSYDDFLRYTKEELNFPSPQSQRFAIDTLEGKHIGNCMCYDIDLRRGEAELGIMIGDQGYWGKGYGTDSVDCLLRHIFTEMPIDRVYLHTLDWNHRAQRAFAKSGFRQVKKVRRSGMDFILMEILRSDWEERRLARTASSTDGAGPDLPEAPLN